MARLLRITLSLISMFRIVDANPFCDSNSYGSPHSTDCVLAMSQLISQDKAVRFFVEEQMRTSPQSPVWAGFQDTRPAFAQEKIIQLPKWTSYGMCTFFAKCFVGTVSQFEGLLMLGNRHVQCCHL